VAHLSRASDDRIPVLYLAPWVDLGGSDKGTIDWFRHLDRDRFAPSLITTQPSDNRWLHLVEPYAEEVWDLPDLMAGAGFPAFILGFIESRGVQVVHIMNSRLAFDLMPDMTNLCEPPVIVVQFHAEEPDRAGYVRYVTTRYGNLVDGFSATSHQLKRALADYDIAGSRVEVIHSGVDAVGEFDPAHVTPFKDLDGHGPRILWPGRLVEQKDPMLTLDVIAAVRDRGIDFTLDVVGDGHLKPAVQRRAAELGVAELIRWHPPSLEMARWYRSADLLLMTSVFEGVPYVIYEALAMEVPVVAPALPGNLEFMDADSGAIVDPRDDVDAYADALALLLEDDALRRDRGERSRQRMLRDFSLREMAARHEQLYDRLLARRPVSARRAGALPSTGEGRFAADAEGPPPIVLPRSPAPERTVGVLVPCHGHGLFLGEALASVFQQTLPAAQVVVVDDGSTDPETIEALEAAERDGRASVIRLPENRGPSAARNRGLRELQTSYVLPLDADDMLLPDALERMVHQLEQAGPQTGFIYPNAQHFGNRNDYVPSPAYNLHTLLDGNYCPAASLFDRRVFEAGVEYPEEIVFGHEDWDLVLQLADRGVLGEVADGPTFLYRRRGFSRVNAVEYGPDSFDEVIRRRHPRLFGDRHRIKGRWAPGLSILLADRGWGPADLSGLTRQTCADFEVLAPPVTDVPPALEATEVIGDPAGAWWLAEAVRRARGRWLLVASPAMGPLLERSTFVERLLHAFWSGGSFAIAFGDAPKGPRLGFRQLDAEARASALPVGVAWSRPPDGSSVTAELEVTGSLLTDLVLAFQSRGPVHWRQVRPQTPAAPAPAMAAVEVGV
jgi:glycosyltransferase involved in cell wall biosynthesis